MGCCVSAEDVLIQSHYRSLSTTEVANLINNQTYCWFCKERIPHPYTLVEECTKCHTIGHRQCVAIYNSTHIKCPNC